MSFIAPRIKARRSRRVRFAPTEIHLENMLDLARKGVQIVPPMPAFYNHPKSVNDIVDHLVGRILDQFDLPAADAKRWDGMRAAREIHTVASFLT
jgi:flavin prenyltransferase